MKQDKSAGSLTISVLDLTQLNRVLINVGTRLSKLEGVGQSPDIHGSRLVNVGAPIASGNALANPLAYSKTTGRPGDDDFHSLDVESSVVDADEFPVWKDTGARYGRIAFSSVSDTISDAVLAAVPTVTDPLYAHSGQTHVVDLGDPSTLSGSNQVNLTNLEAYLGAIKTALNSVIAALESSGLTLSS
jgi:hypothetical protein